jgi:hypothetical protein
MPEIDGGVVRRIIFAKGRDAARTGYSIYVLCDRGLKPFGGTWLEPGEAVERWLRLNDDTRPELNDAWERAIRLIVNTILYINERRRAGKWEPTDRQRRGMRSVWNLGGEIKLSRELREAARHSGRLPAWRVRARFIVRGHWRRQACGLNRAERRPKWIAPFWKGPKDGPELQRLYALDLESKEDANVGG